MKRSQERKEEELVEKRDGSGLKEQKSGLRLQGRTRGAAAYCMTLGKMQTHTASLSVRILPQGLGSKSGEGVTGLLWGHPSAPTSVQPCGPLSPSYPWKLLAVGTSLFQQRPPDRDIVMTSLKITEWLGFL